MDSLDSLEQNLQQLLERYAALQEENAALRVKNEGLKQDLEESHAELNDLRRECRNLHVANSMLGSQETRTEAYGKLTHMIRQVDKAIELIKN